MNIGQRVRHKSFGRGKVLSIKQRSRGKTGRPTALVAWESREGLSENKYGKGSTWVSLSSLTPEAASEEVGTLCPEVIQPTKNPASSAARIRNAKQDSTPRSVRPPTSSRRNTVAQASTSSPKGRAMSPGMAEIRSLEQPWPWTMGLAGLVKWLSWQTDNLLGLSKTRLIKRVIEECVEQSNDANSADILYEVIKEGLDEGRRNAEARTAYEKPRSGVLISPPEAQRRLCFFSEDYLNKEFDIFLSLLPAIAVTNYLNQHFSVGDNCRWNIYGNGNDFYQSTQMEFMQMDTLAYSSNGNTLVALELKVDAAFTDEQLSKYCFMVAYLREKKFIDPAADFKLLVIGCESFSDDVLRGKRASASTCIAQGPHPRRGLKPNEAEALAPKASEVLSRMELGSTTWQLFGEHFSETLSRRHLPEKEMYTKLVNGFLWSLARKRSKKTGQSLYHAQGETPA